MGCFLGDRRAFGINADHWTITAQDKGEWRRTAERFMAKWIAGEKARVGLRHPVVCPNVTGTTKKRIAQSKRARAGSLTKVDKPQQVARICILRADVVLSFSGVTFVLFCFVATVCVLFRFCFFIFLFLWKCRFSRVFFVPSPFSLCMESTSYVFSFLVVFFYPVTTGWIFDISLCENSNKKTKYAGTFNMPTSYL